jgi:isoleucyl-tRNA synthetase
MTKKYPEFSKLDLPAFEKKLLAEWADGEAFKKSVSLRDGAQPFVFYEGPPSANGLPGIHHVISRTLKDLVCRYKTMRGYQVKRKGGWDTHGLPVELSVEKLLGITKEDIGKKISVAEYNTICRREVLKYKDKWDELTRQMGYWVDLEDPYITFDNHYIETLWYLLKQLFDKNLLYKDVSIQPYSPAAGTGLSSHELNQPGTYRDVKDTSVVAMFAVARQEQAAFLFQAAGDKPVSLLAWTTTPWTLPSNLALTVGTGIDYVLVKTFNPYTHQPVHVILARATVVNFFKAAAENGDFDAYRPGDPLIPWQVLKTFKGNELEGLRYDQLMPFEANRPEKTGGDPFRVLTGDFVTTEDGTGIVHTAPAFGADDFRVGKKAGIGILTLVDRQGRFVDGVGEFSGRYIKDYTDDPGYEDVNVDICVKLKKEGSAFKVEKFTHSYPHCWRTDKPVIYYPLDAWFIRTTAMKDRLIALNKTIQWKPAFTGTGRFGNWLENMVDWNLSRSRFWGTPLPVWATTDRREVKCIGSIPELKAEVEKSLKAGILKKIPWTTWEDLDLHKPFVDELLLVSGDGRPMYREPDLVDVWFDSGSMPYAQWGLDHEKLRSGHPRPFRTPFEDNFPADFIAEGVDQTRGWFYTLHAIAGLLFDSVAYKTVVANGLVLDKEGNKMSKRVGNVIDPFDTIRHYGADATRWYLITNASPWDSLRFDTEGIKEVQRKLFNTLYNTYGFFAMYANIDGFTFQQSYIPVRERPEIDRWIISSLNSLIRQVTAHMDEYEPTRAGRAIQEFVDEHLSNWYVRLCRRRFWKPAPLNDTEAAKDKIAAYQTLYECMEKVVRLMAPISPFFTDWLFRNLNGCACTHNATSVHHTDWPEVVQAAIDPSLEERMKLAQDISSLVLSVRKKVRGPGQQGSQTGIKVRQPLQKILIPVSDEHTKEQIERVSALIRHEVNVKEIRYLSDTEGFIHKKIRPDYKALGKKLGPKMKAVALKVAAFSRQDIALMEKQGYYDLGTEDGPLRIGLDEVEITSEDIPGWSVANKGPLTIALDTTLTPELEEEGIARELINRIQRLRKDQGFELTDRIIVKLSESEPLKSAIIHFNTYICTEILADAFETVPELEAGTEIEVNDIKLNVLVLKNK